MGFLNRLFGRGDPPEERRPAPARRGFAPSAGASDDERALERYRYLLRTAPPEAVEQAHEEAFAKLTPAQRAQVLRELAQHVPAHERAADDDPRSLARMATRAELRQPGTMERAFGMGRGGGMGMGGGMMGGGGIGLGGLIGGTILGSIVGNVVGGAITNEFFDNDPGFNEPGLNDPGPNEQLGDGEMLANQEEYAGDLNQDFGALDAGTEDFGGGDDFGGGEI